MLPYFKKVSRVFSLQSRIVGNQDLTLHANTRPKPSPLQVLRWLQLVTFRGMTRSGATPVQCSFRTPTTSTREAVREP